MNNAFVKLTMGDILVFNLLSWDNQIYLTVYLFATLHSPIYATLPYLS